MIGLSFYSIRTTDEFLWKNNCQTLYVIYNSLCIFPFSIEQNAIMQEGDLKGGGLATVLIVAQSILKTQEPPNHIEFQDMNFLLKVGNRSFSGNRCIGILLVKKNLMILQEKLDRFMTDFETHFAATLENWGGNASPFSEEGGKIAQIFQLKR